MNSNILSIFQGHRAKACISRIPCKISERYRKISQLILVPIHPKNFKKSSERFQVVDAQICQKGTLTQILPCGFPKTGILVLQNNIERLLLLPEGLFNSSFPYYQKILNKHNVTFGASNHVAQKRTKNSFLVFTQLTFTCSESTIEILEKRCEICSKLTMKIPERRQ